MNKKPRKIEIFYFMQTDVLPADMYMYYIYAWCPRKSEEGIGFPGTGVTDGCRLPHRYRKSNPDHLKEQ